MGNVKDFVEAISTNSYADAKDAISALVESKLRSKIDSFQGKLGLKKDKDEDEDDMPKKKKAKKRGEDHVEGEAELEEGEDGYGPEKSRNWEKSTGDAEFRLCSNYFPIKGFKAGNSPDDNKKKWDSMEKSTGDIQSRLCKSYMPLPFKQTGSAQNRNQSTGKAGVNPGLHEGKDGKDEMSVCKGCKNRKLHTDKKKMNADGDYED